MTEVISFASSESFKTQFGILSGPGEVCVRDVDRALRISKTVKGIAISGWGDKLRGLRGAITAFVFEELSKSR